MPVTFVQDSPASESPFWNDADIVLEPQGEHQTHSIGVDAIDSTPMSTSQSQSASGIRRTDWISEIPQVNNTDIPSTSPLTDDPRTTGPSTVIPPSPGNSIQHQQPLILPTIDWTGATPPLSSPDAPSTTPANLTAREAFLLRAFIQKMAPWVSELDVTRRRSVDGDRSIFVTFAPISPTTCLAEHSRSPWSSKRCWRWPRPMMRF